MRRLIAATIAVVVVAADLRAHEAEHTAVTVTFARDGSFVLEVANDPNWLLLRLESFRQGQEGQEGQEGRKGREGQKGQVAPANPAARDERLRELAALFIDRIVFFVDGHEVRPASVEYIAPEAGAPAPLAAYRMRGRVASDARVLRWHYGMVADPYPLAINRADGRTVNEWIVTGEAWSRPIDLTEQFVKPTSGEIMRRYVSLGYARLIRHAGHVLFVLGLCLLGFALRSMALQVSAFTLGHLLGLAMAAFGVISIGQTTTAALVGLSVGYVTIENLLTTELKPWRLPAVALFGVVHGTILGRALTDRMLTADEIPAALAWFTVGVEGAQLTIVAIAVLLLRVRLKPDTTTVRSVRL